MLNAVNSVICTTGSLYLIAFRFSINLLYANHMCHPQSSVKKASQPSQQAKTKPSEARSSQDTSVGHTTKDCGWKLDEVSVYDTLLDTWNFLRNPTDKTTNKEKDDG